MIDVYNKKGKKCKCELSQLDQVLASGFTREEPVVSSSPKATKSSGKNPNSTKGK